jgi:Tol biopolymer transport system component
MFKILLVSCLAAVAASSQAPEPKADVSKPAAKKGLSLEYTSKLEFSTDEGTWLSVSVSRDSSTIVFDLLGDLYTLPIAGGEAKRITQGPAFDSQPVFSPVSDRIAFISDRDGADNLWIALADGSSPKQLTKDRQSEWASPAFTPDGEYVVVSRQAAGGRTYELWMYNIHGGSGVQVTKAQVGSQSAAAPPVPGGPPPPRLNFMGVSPSRDGKYFYYAKRTGGFAYNVTFPLWQIARRDRVTGEEDTITNSNGSGIRPVISPDGEKLVFGTRYKTETGLRIRDLKTGDEKWLKYPVTRDDQESRFTRDTLPGYAFTPDGKSIVVSYGGKLHRVNVDDGSEQPIPFTAQVSLDTVKALHFPLRVDEGVVKVRLVQQPVLSPDGKRIAFSALTHLYVMDLEGGAAPRRVASAAGNRLRM